METNIIEWNLHSMLRLFKLSLFSIINESSFPIALFIELIIVANSLTQDNLAAYAAISATLTFALNIFNFLVMVTMAQVSKAVGEKNWLKVGSKLRIAMSTGLLIGLCCALILFFLTPYIFHFMGLSSTVRNVAEMPFKFRLISLPFMMMQRVCIGTLGGYQRLQIMAILAIFVSILEVASQVYALRFMKGDLLDATIGRVIVSGIGWFLSFMFVLWFPPKEANGNIQMFRCCTLKNNDATMISVNLLEEKVEESKTEGCWNTIFLEYFIASGNLIIRSILLTGSVYAMSVMAGNLGTSALAAHQIAITLWMVTSYVCDGFADVGTMVGANLLARNKFKQLLTLRNILMFFGSITGAIAGIIMFLFRIEILSLFHINDKRTSEILMCIWPILCIMQIVNACVFVLDGLIYAAHAFRFVRNLMLIACLCVFAPLLFFVSSIPTFHSLFYIWIAKTGLNTVRGIGALWLWYISLPMKWQMAKI